MTEEKLKHPKSELRAAAKALDSMRTADSLDDLEAEWREFLTCLEKTWVKAERSCQHIRNQFQPWQGKYSKLRKKDMLLRYLKQARDADNHSIQDFTKIEPGSKSIRFTNPTGGYINRMEISGGEIAVYEGDPMLVLDKPPHPVVVPVKNHGQWFNPPTSHLDQPLLSLHPVELAEHGLKFYDEFIREIEQKFFA